ncbi:MAG: 3-methyl-2-oxobutanoate hydroxymethyltransferase, partial [Phycisphaeraceae bacterium]
MAITVEAPSGSKPARVTLRTLRKWVKAGERFAMLTCYDATTATWLWRGGVRCLLVGDTAAQMILGHDSTLPATMPFMLEITAAVRRGAPDAFVMADMPFGSYQCGQDQAVHNAMRFLTEGMADVVKLEVDASFAPLVERLSHAGV